MYKIIVSAALLFAGFSMASCQNQTKPKASGSIINETISVDDFEKKLTEIKNIQLVDVRTPEEYEEGHLKNAFNYNINGSNFENQLNTLDKNKPVMVYCLGGGRSAEAAGIMEEKEFTQIYNMKGGMMKWNAANKPTEKGSVVPLASTGLSTQDFNNLLKTDKFVLIDYNAKWCKPCKKMAPMLDALAEKKKDKLVIIKIDADENKSLLKEKQIEAIPFFQLYKDGKLVWTHEGEINEETLLKETKL